MAGKTPGFPGHINVTLLYESDMNPLLERKR